MITRRTFLAAPAAAPAANWLNIASRGAVAGSEKPNTAAIQSAIDAAAAAGGGTVLVPPGRFLTGGLRLRSRVCLRLEPGAVLAGSTRLEDYPVFRPAFRSYTDNYTERSLLYAEDCDEVSLEGSGTFDGQGAAFKGEYKVRPYMFRFVSCRNVSATGVHVLDSPMWVQHYLNCTGVRLAGLRVRSLVNQNNDGIDIDCSSQVRISDCEIESGDDAIVLKSTAPVPCRDVAITNCTLSSRCNALKLGTETNGGFEDVVVSNCTVRDTRLAGLAIEIVDGGTLDRLSVAGLSMRNVGAPIFVRLGNRARPHTEGAAPLPTGRMRNIIVAGVQASGCGPTGCAVSGLPGHPIENLTLRDVRLEFAGGGTAADAARVPEEWADRYPEFHMFGRLPAYGFYFRHVRGLRLRDVEMRTVSPEARPAQVFVDAEQA
jgi:polygalacturonase